MSVEDNIYSQMHWLMRHLLNNILRERTRKINTNLCFIPKKYTYNLLR